MSVSQKSLMLRLVAAAILVLSACGTTPAPLASTTTLPPSTTLPPATALPPSTTQSPATTLPPATALPPSTEAPPSTSSTSPTTAPSPPPPQTPIDVFAVDWWGCWHAGDATDTGGQTPADGAVVAELPNCADGEQSVGTAGDMSHPEAAPPYRPTGADGGPSIEFTHAADTLLQTNGGQPWTGDDVLEASVTGVTLAWIGTVTDVNSHDVKYLVSGLDQQAEYPMLLVEGQGPNRFAGYGGGTIEARSTDGTILDGVVHGVIVHLAPDGSASSVEVDGIDLADRQDSRMQGDVTGLTLGNIFSRNFSTTDHQFVFLGLRQGELTAAERAGFWEFVDGL